MQPEARVRVVVHGHVQGVFFRDSLRRLAEAHGVAGSARNAPDGTVVAVLEGESAALEVLLAFCRTGPPAARVERVDLTDEEPTGLRGFEIR